MAADPASSHSCSRDTISSRVVGEMHWRLGGRGRDLSWEEVNAVSGLWRLSERSLTHDCTSFRRLTENTCSQSIDSSAEVGSVLHEVSVFISWNQNTWVFLS